MPYLNNPKKIQTRKLNRESRQKIYQTTEWKKLRLAKLQQNPLCEPCLTKGVVTPAIDIHHIDSFTKYDGTKSWQQLLTMPTYYQCVNSVIKDYIISYFEHHKHLGHLNQDGRDLPSIQLLFSQITYNLLYIL